MDYAKRLRSEREQTQKEFAGVISRHFEDFGIVPMDKPLEGEEPIGKLRSARRRRGQDEKIGVMTLMETDGVLRWESHTSPAPSRRYGPGRRLRRDARAAVSDAICQFKFEDLPPNKIGERLRQLDNLLTRKQGLYSVSSTARLGRPAVPKPQGRILLFVHGTFSKCEHLIQEINATKEGKELFQRLVKGDHYGQVLAFNHPTVSASPILNAAALAHHFRNSAAEVDVICHSRGGLVVRWWLEALDHLASPRGRVIFAGSPLAGTGLAAPARLRGALNLLTNISQTLKVMARTSGMVFPVMAPLGEAAAILFSLFGKVTAVAAKTPIIDAGVAMIPGLAAQSREGANSEIIQLRKSFGELPESVLKKQFLNNYHFLTSDFEPTDPRWRFWRHFRKDQLLDRAADLVFEGANDLVVDTTSMTSLANGIERDKLAKVRVEDFGGQSEDVHHFNYFQQPETIKFINKALRLA